MPRGTQVCAGTFRPKRTINWKSRRTRACATAIDPWGSTSKPVAGVVSPTIATMTTSVAWPPPAVEDTSRRSPSANKLRSGGSIQACLHSEKWPLAIASHGWLTTTLLTDLLSGFTLLIKRRNDRLSSVTFAQNESTVHATHARSNKWTHEIVTQYRLPTLGRTMRRSRVRTHRRLEPGAGNINTTRRVASLRGIELTQDINTLTAIEVFDSLNSETLELETLVDMNTRHSMLRCKSETSR